MLRFGHRYGSLSLLVLLAAGCSSDTRGLTATSESCMLCHNGSPHDDYDGSGIENPHPFAPADNLRCTTCHGGNPAGNDKVASHVPPPPQIGDRENLDHNAEAYFNRLTLTGMDRYPDYEVDGQTHTALDYLQFINPGDLRVVTESRSCGQCHSGHAECVENSLLATSAGIFSGALYAAGAENRVLASRGLYEDTAAGTGFRAIEDPDFDVLTADLGAVVRLRRFPVFSGRGAENPDSLFNNDAYNAADLSNDRNPDNSVITDSHLANLYAEQVAFTCGDCHLGSAGANNRYGDFRSSGCTSCHMQYSLDGRSRSGDPNVNRYEPEDPDDIDDPELPHIARHLIRSTAKTLPSGEFVRGISDYACAGCHQGSNRTVMQYWGIRLDQNEDVPGHDQYPADPDSFVTTRDDTRLFDPVVDNDTFNGRRDRQYLLFEDYDADGRDDTPADVHYEAGMGCIDCHGSFDLHGGDVSDPHSGAILSRMGQAVAIRCESCHGGADEYATTATGTSHAGETADLAVDRKGNVLKHVVMEADGEYYLYSKLTGRRHYIKQTKDTIVDSGKVHPDDGDPIFSIKASYAMGRADGSATTGIGPKQSGGDSGFSHGDSVSCAACHSSWTNSCIGCHLEGEYDNGNNFSNITGERIVFREENADFVYQSPVPFQLGIGPDNEIVPMAANTDAFFQYEDKDNQESERFAFSDRNGGGNNQARATHPSLSHNFMMPHSIRGKVDDQNEGARYCVACHLTDEGLADYGSEYATLRNAMSTGDYTALDLPFYQKLKNHIGRNPGNQMNSPLWVHMAAGLGTGLFFFDEHGGAVNPLDDEANRAGSEGTAPADNFDLARVRFNLDRLVDETGASTGSNNHPMRVTTPNRRDGALNPNLSGPMGATLLRRLTDPNTGIVLDAWIDADGMIHGDPGNFQQDP